MKTTLSMLRKLTENLPDDTVVLVPSHGATYRSPRVAVTQVALEGKALWGEWSPESDDPALVALVVGE